MATISGTVTIGPDPGAAEVLLLDASGSTVIASTTSDPVTGAYSFSGLSLATTFLVMVKGGGVYRSRAYGPCTTGVAWTPSNLSAPPKIWLNPDTPVTDAGAGACSQWDDASGNGYHFTQSAGAARPLIVASGIGGRRILRFDGTNDYLLNNSGGARGILSGVSTAWAAAVYDKVSDAVGAIRTIFGVSPTTGGGLLFGLGAGSSAAGLENIPRIQARRLNGDTVATCTADVVRTDPVMLLCAIDYQNRRLTTWVNGVMEEELTGAWASGGPCQSGTANRDVRVGADTNTTVGSFLNADLGELIVATPGTMLSDDDVARVFGYMAHPWGLTSLLPVGHPYKTDAPEA